MPSVRRQCEGDAGCSEGSGHCAQIDLRYSHPQGRRQPPASRRAPPPIPPWHCGAATNRKLLGIVDIMAGPGRGALLVREIFQRDGHTAEVERLLVYSVRDELLWQCWVYDQDQTLVDSFLS